MLLKNLRLVNNGLITDNAWIAISGTTIDGWGHGSRADGTDLNGLIVTPGFVDMHIHGAAGHDFGSSDIDHMPAIAASHLAHGTTTMLAGIGSDPIPAMVDAARRVTQLPVSTTIAGTFFEGPFLSVERKGAHDPQHLRQPDIRTMDELLQAGGATVRLVAIAPELPGAVDLIRYVAHQGTVVAVGHTDASYETTRAAFDAGARVATHLFNGMRPIHHRDPGPVLAAMEDDRVTCELIADGYHVSNAVMRHVFDTIGPHRIALITDAIEATNVGDGTYHHSTSTIVVKDGLAMLEDGSSIAGSTLTMDRAVRRVVREVGVSLPHAVQSTTASPARTLGIDNTVGAVAEGLTANLVVLDDGLRVQAVVHRGSWVTQPGLGAFA